MNRFRSWREGGPYAGLQIMLVIALLFGAVVPLTAWAGNIFRPQPVCLVADGDSRTRGAFNSIATGNYPQQLGEVINALRVVNLGEDGATSGDVLKHRLPSAVLGCRNEYLLEVGANDGILGYPAGETERNIAARLEQVQRYGYESWALTEPPSAYVGNPPDYERKRIEVNQWKREHFHVCDISADVSLQDPSMWTSDGLHPVTLGYGIEARDVALCITGRYR